MHLCAGAAPFGLAERLRETVWNPAPLTIRTRESLQF
jgi:hypothetical protein